MCTATLCAKDQVVIPAGILARLPLLPGMDLPG